MISSCQTKRITSFFVVFLLVISLLFGCITPVHATEDKVELDKYSFLETVCSMFNCFYLPDGYASSDMSTWDHRGNYSSQYDTILLYLDYLYKYNIGRLGFQTTDSTLDTYVRPYFYWYGNIADFNSVYRAFKTDGCLDFVNSMSENEYVVIRECFNTFYKLMYDYNYNLSEYNILEIASSVPVITFVNTTGYPIFHIGYGIPPYYLKDEGIRYYDEEISSAIEWIEAYSATGFDVENYIACFRSGELQYTVVGSYLTMTELDKITYDVYQNYQVSYVWGSPVVAYAFQSRYNNETQKYYAENTSTTIYNNPTSSGYYTRVDGSQGGLVISPLLGTYFLNGTNIHNWAQDLIVGSSESWTTYGSFVGDSLGSYSVPSLADVNSIIANDYNNNDSSSIVDNISGIYTGKIEVDEEEVPEFDYDRIDETMKDAVDSILNSGDYSESDRIHGGLGDKLDEYYQVEDQINDFTNMDSFSESYWNTTDMFGTVTNLSNVSNCFMIIWDSFGPFNVLFMTIIGIGLAAYLLKFRKK